MQGSALNRRAFAKTLVVGSTATLPLSRIASGASAVAGQQATTAADEEDTLAPADHVLELVKQRYPQRLKQEHLAVIRGEIARHLARSPVLSAFPLTVADEPVFVFSAFRAD